MGWLILIIVMLVILLVLSVWWGLKQKSKPVKIQKNIDVLLDHQQTDAVVRRKQEAIKKKIIEAKNEKESDDVIKHFRSVFNSSKL